MNRRALAWCALLAFLFHWVWETTHGVAYVETRLPLRPRLWHCLPMAIVDTGWTLGLIGLGVAVAAITRHHAATSWSAALAGALTAAILERWALAVGRWTYNELMPVVPVLDVGLWPVLQMTVLPALVLWAARRVSGSHQRL